MFIVINFFVCICCIGVGVIVIDGCFVGVGFLCALFVVCVYIIIVVRSFVVYV